MSEPQLLADGVVRLGSSYVNWYLVADESGVTIVDTGLPGFRDQLEPGLAALGRSMDDVRAVILTHGDADHTGVAGKLAAERPERPIHLSARDEYLVRGSGKKTEDSALTMLYRPSIYRLLFHFMRNGARPKSAVIEGTIPLEPGTLDVPGQPLVIESPGHTEGHVSFHFPAHGALCVGDALCTWNPATNERGAQLMRPGFNVSNSTALDSLAAYEGLEAALVLPGHGEPWTDGPDAAVASARAVDAGLTRA